MPISSGTRCLFHVGIVEITIFMENSLHYADYLVYYMR